MNKLQLELARQKGAKVAEMEALAKVAADGNRSFTKEEQATWDGLDAECSRLAMQIDNIGKIERHKVAVKLDHLGQAEPEPDAGRDFLQDAAKHVVVVQEPRGAKALKCFKNKEQWATAYKQGMVIQAMMGNAHAAQWVRDHGLAPSAVHQEGTNSTGGYLVLPEFDREIINLTLQYGIFEQYARRSPMTSDTKDRNRRTGGLTMYAVGEGSAGTESTKSWDRVSLVAKKWMVLTRISNELNADAIISLMDDLADEVAMASATKKDQCGFIGTGASTYQGIHGVQQRLSALNGVDDGGGLVLGAGNLASEITMANYNSMIGALPNYANARPNWWCSKWWWANTMQRLETAAGGNTIRDIQGGTSNVLFMGYPVVWTEVLPTSDATSQIAALFGDLRLAADYGDRQATTIAISDSATIGTTSVFESDEKALRWTERWDINVHDVGTATVAGPVVGLISAAS